MKGLTAAVLSFAAIAASAFVAAAPAQAKGSPQACLGYEYAYIHIEAFGLPPADTGFQQITALKAENSCAI